MLRRIAPLLASSLLAACVVGAPEGSEEADATATAYVDAATFLKTDADRAAWKQVVSRLENDFYDVCGDTFCGGDYSNLTSLGLACAVSSKVGQVHECVWTFAGSAELVNPTTGALTVSKPSFQCKLTPKTTIAKLITTLSAPGSDSALQRPLPGGTSSVYDEIGDCFQHPIGASPLSPSYSTNAKYMLATDAPATDVDAWYGAQSAFQQAFAAACGSSFCEDGLPNLTALRLVCATSVTTGNIKSCAAVLAGSTASVSATKGTVTPAPESYRCSLPMKGTPNDLSTLINAANATPVLDRTLPGSTKTLRAALAACL